MRGDIENTEDNEGGNQRTESGVLLQRQKMPVMAEEAKTVDLPGNAKNAVRLQTILLASH